MQETESTSVNGADGRIGVKALPLLSDIARNMGIEVLPSTREKKAEKKAKKEKMHERALEAFTMYLDMGPTRTLPKLAERLGVSVSSVEYWSWQYGWKQEIQGILERRKGQDLDGDWGEINRGRVNGIRSTYRMFRWLEALTDIIDKAVSERRPHTPAEIIQMARYKRAMKLTGIRISDPADLKNVMLTLKGLVDFEGEPGGKKATVINNSGNLIIKG